MLRHSKDPDPLGEGPALRTVRLLRSEAELAEASARAAVHARRLRDRLDARAAKDAWTAEYRADGGHAPRAEGGAAPGRGTLVRGPHVAPETHSPAA
jgi:hypothetical protein